jgi:ribosomal protein S6--L-glutamate ligase
MLIYILSRGATLYSTARIYRAALKSKHNVRIIDHMQCDLLIERGRFIVIYNNEVLMKPDLIIPRIGNSATIYGTTVVRHFQEMGAPVLNTPSGIYNSRDKFRSLQLLAGQNIPIPVTYFSNDLHQAERIVKGKLGYPFILKVLEGTQGVGVHLVKNEFEAFQLMNRFAAAKEKIILQEFIEEFKGKDIRVFIVGNKVVASMMRIANAGEFRSNIHRGGSGEKIVLSEEEREMAIRAVKILGLQIAGVDILRSKKGAVIIEVNSSPGLEGIEGVTGVEVAEEIIHYIEERYLN